MKLKSLRQIDSVFHKYDPYTFVNASMLKRLTDDGILPFEMHGNRLICDLDVVIQILNETLGLYNYNGLPHIRSINSAIAELKATGNDVGIGEDRLRKLIDDDIVPSISIGIRNYIAMEIFTAPYISYLSNIKTTIKKENDDAFEQVMQQVNSILKKH